VADAVNSFTSSDYTYDTTVQGYKTAIDSARTSVSASLNDLIGANESFSLGTGSSVGDARVSQIKSSIASIEASLQKSKIRAPFAGTVTRQDAKVGQVAQSGTTLVTIISESDMYVEANISEINIGKVSVGNRAEVEFDAYPGEKFMGTVTFIDPGETLIDDVVNYKIRIELDETEKDIKSGLTVAAKIVSREKQGVASIPFYTVTKEGEKTFVNKLENGTPVKTEISLGIVGSNGDAEILSGLGEGDEVSY
jgi:RND family efflux transporter MFP subunit